MFYGIVKMTALVDSSGSNSFLWQDYAVVFLTLLLSTLIGIYFGCFGSKQASTQEYLFGGKKLRVLHIAASLAISHFSGANVLILPADVYRYGANIWYASLAFLLMAIIAIFVYLPVFFQLQLTSVYEYLEKRFDLRTRLAVSIFYVLSEMLKYPILAYLPCLAFATASGVNLKLTICVTCGICVFYTAIGGLKAVVWTDIFQLFVIAGCVVTVYILSLKSSGGFLSVWKAAVDGKRLDIFNFDFDPTIRDNFWTWAICFSFYRTSEVAIHQTGVQKLLALPSFRQIIRSLMYSTIVMFFVDSFSVLIGLAIYARFLNCDPLAFKKIGKHEELVPFYIKDVASGIPGIAGLFVAAVLSASLSSMSSNLNALAGVIYKDFIVLFLKENPSERSAAIILRSTVVIVGVICTCLVYSIEYLGEVVSVLFSVTGMINGPILGIFTLGVLFPRGNAKGAFYGGVAGVILMMTLIISAKHYQLRHSMNYPSKPFSFNECDIWNNSSRWFNNSIDLTKLSTSSNRTLDNPAPYIYRISFLYYTLIGMVVTLILALIVSYATNKNQIKVDENLLSPIRQNLFCYKTKRNRRNQCIGVPEALQMLDTTNK